MPRHSDEKLRCVQYFGIYFIISGVAIFSIGAAETGSWVSNFTYAGLTFISCGAFMMLAHYSMRNIRRVGETPWRDRPSQSPVFNSGSDEMVTTVDVNIETVRDYLEVSKRTGNAAEINIRKDGRLECALNPEDEVDPALLTACSIPDMDVNTLDLRLPQITTLGRVLRLIKRSCTTAQYESGRICSHEDGTLAIHIWHGFGVDNLGYEADQPPVYEEAVRIPPIREEDPPSYNDVILTIDSAL